MIYRVFTTQEFDNDPITVAAVGYQKARRGYLDIEIDVDTLEYNNELNRRGAAIDRAQAMLDRSVNGGRGSYHTATDAVGLKEDQPRAAHTQTPASYLTTLK